MVLKFSENHQVLAAEIKCIKKLEKAIKKKREIKPDSHFPVPKLINYGILVFDKYRN